VRRSKRAADIQVAAGNPHEELRHLREQKMSEVLVLIFSNGMSFADVAALHCSWEGEKKTKWEKKLKQCRSPADVC
jgi:hypothetical protein